MKTKTVDEVLHIMAQVQPIDTSMTQGSQNVLGSSLNDIGNVNGPEIPRIISGNAHNSNNEISPFGNPYVPISQQKHNSPREPPTPASDAKDGSPSGVNEGMYSAMHDRFGRGEFGQAQVYNNATIPVSQNDKAVTGNTITKIAETDTLPIRPFVPSQPINGEGTSDSVPKKKRASPRARCPECRTKRRRCVHGESGGGAVSRTPSRELPLPALSNETTQSSQVYYQPASTNQPTVAGPDAVSYGISAQQALMMHNGIYSTTANPLNTFGYGSHGQHGTNTTSDHDMLEPSINAYNGQINGDIIGQMSVQGVGSVQADGMGVPPHHVEQLQFQQREIQQRQAEQHHAQQSESELGQAAEHRIQKVATQQPRQEDNQGVEKPDAGMQHGVPDQHGAVQANDNTVEQTKGDQQQQTKATSDPSSDDPLAEASTAPAAEGVGGGKAAPKRRGRSKRSKYSNQPFLPPRY